MHNSCNTFKTCDNAEVSFNDPHTQKYVHVPFLPPLWWLSQSLVSNLNHRDYIRTSGIEIHNTTGAKPHLTPHGRNPWQRTEFKLTFLLKIKMKRQYYKEKKRKLPKKAKRAQQIASPFQILSMNPTVVLSSLSHKINVGGCWCFHIKQGDERVRVRQTATRKATCTTDRNT